MTYELAKQLKEAGFPFRYAQLPNEIVKGCQFDDGSIAYFPTLSEFIKACGNDFTELFRTSNGHFSARALGNFWGPEAHIPEEAVAGLWLALHKPNVVDRFNKMVEEIIYGIKQRGINEIRYENRNN